MQLFQRGTWWWVRFSHGGKQHRLPTGEKKKTRAQSIAADLIKKVERGEDPRAVPVEPPTLKEFAEGWFAEWVKTTRSLKEKSREGYQYGISLLAKQTFYRQRMDLITRQDVNMMVIPGSPSKFNTAVRTIRRMYHLALEEKRIGKCPVFNALKERGRKELIKPEEEREISAILASKSIGREHGSVRVALPLYRDMNLQPFEIVSLRIEDIDFERNKVTLQKSGRKVEMSQAAREALVKQCRGKDLWVFPSDRLPGQPLRRQAISKGLFRAKNGKPNAIALQVAWPVHMDTGLRPMEMAKMRIEHVDLTKKTIRVIDTKSEAGEREIPLPDRSVHVLFAHLAGRTDGWLFPSPRYPGKPITRAALTQAFARARTLAGIPKSKKLYSARHTFGTDLLRATRDPKLTMELMGHSEFSVTAKYTHNESDQVAELMNERNRKRQEILRPKQLTN